MKKTLALMMIMLLSIIVLSACGEESNIPNDPYQSSLEDQNEEDLTDEEKANRIEKDLNEKDDLTGSDNLAENEDQDEKDEKHLSPIPGAKIETHTVILYFPDNDFKGTYRIEMDIKVRNEGQLAKAALEAWIKGPEHPELKAIIHPEVIVEYVEEVNGIAHVSFSNDIIKSNLGSDGELMLAEQIAMIMQQFGYEQTQILVEGEIRETLLGSVYIGEPIYADIPRNYLWIEEKEPGFLLQNVAFRISEPVPNAEVKDRIIVRGLARVFEGTIQYEFEDGHYILDKGFTTSSEGAPGWGEFEIVIEFDNASTHAGRIILYEESAKDGSRLHELKIPVNIIY